MIYLVTFMTKKSYKTAKKWAHGDNCHPPHRTVAFLHGNCPKIMKTFCIPYYLIQFPRKLFFFEFGNCRKFKQLSQYLYFLVKKLNFYCENSSNEETIQGRKLYEAIRYLFFFSRMNKGRSLVVSKFKYLVCISMDFLI